MKNKKSKTIRFFLAFFLMLFLLETPLKGQDDELEIFMWVGAQKLQDKDPMLLENMLLFARRNGIIPYSSGMNEPRKLEMFLSTCKDLDIPKTWIEIGPGKEVSIRDFVEKPLARETILKNFRKLGEIYRKHYPEFARVTLFDEAPLGAFGMVKGEDNGYIKQLEQFMQYGPKAYSHLQKNLKQAMPNAEVGIFMHHPHNASEEMAGEYSVIGEFVKECNELGTLPDFIFSDVYRGYFNRGYGMEKTDAYITDVAAYTKEIAEKYRIKAYQLGQMHTIKLGYTPSRYEIDRNIEAMLKGNADGIGWYWPNYASTGYKRQSRQGIGNATGYKVSFDPFVPNAWGGIGPAGSVYGTSKDRFVYSYLRMLEKQHAVRANTHFDLWIYGFDFDHNEHTLYLKTNNSWEKIGHFNPQQDKEAYEEGAREKYIYTYHERWHALAFHGLSREKYISGEKDGKIQLRIETPGQSDHSKLSAIYVVPYRETRNYVTEQEITRFIEEQPRWVEINSMGSHVRPKSLILKPDEPVELMIK
ncbi:MAG: hypothetical protein K9I94_01325 [Bacteroidales bacterium]|nr:hypothetical protein [Bacteroidales bacterium]